MGLRRLRVNNTYNFTYNLDGLRTKKNSNGTNTFYYYDDSNNLIGLKKGNTTVLFYYDSNGQVYSMSKGEDTYFFIKNLQGDVMKIIDENGTTVATYVYDAWGALLSQSENGSIAGLSPFRYRSYVYDTDTELYYLQSRYYDPKIGRFINADSPEYTDTYSGSPLSTNMFAYCENDSINNVDYSGNWYHTLKQYNKFINQMRKHGGPSSDYRDKYSRIRENYIYNRDKLGIFNGYIFGQYSSYVCDLKFGPGYKVRNNGCGLVAIYNVMKCIGRSQNFARVILEAELNGILWLNGLFGTTDKGIGKYFDAHKVKYDSYKKYKDFKKAFKNKKNKYKIAIIYQNNEGNFIDSLKRHYFCIIRRDNDTYVSLNLYSDHTEFKDVEWKDIDNIRFICAFCIK